MTEILYTYEPDTARFVATTDEGQEVGTLVYAVEDRYWNAKHTWVNPDFRGHNIARKLLDMLVDTARAQGVLIFPTCSYARHVMEKDASFADVLFKPETE